MNDLAESPATRIRQRAGDHRVDHQAAFVLHTYPWRETSLVVEALTRDHGRIALVARGAKRRTSQLRGLLSPFSALSLAWSGRGETKTLMRAEWTGGLAPLRGDSLLAAFYMNELLVRLLARGDAHPVLFGAYAQSLRVLADDGRIDATLRAFEFALLREVGYLPSLDVCADGQVVEPEARYRVDPQRGLVRAERSSESVVVAGSSALSMAAGDFSAAGVAADSKAMLRLIIRYHLEGRPLNTRRILQDLREL